MRDLPPTKIKNMLVKMLTSPQLKAVFESLKEDDFFIQEKKCPWFLLTMERQELI